MLIFLDLETTGVETSDVICSIALLSENGPMHEYVNEGKKIPSDASSIHHITNEMIKNRPPLEETQLWRFLEEHNSSEHILVGHNIEFDLGFLARKGFVWQGKSIDTLRVSKHLLPECELFSLQFLRYELKLYRVEEGAKQKYGIKNALVAHNALSDAVVTQLLFDSLSEMASIEEMCELSRKKVLLLKLSFGKYRLKYIEEIASNDRGYLEWMLSLDDLDEDLRYSIEYYLQG